MKTLTNTSLNLTDPRLMASLATCPKCRAKSLLASRVRDMREDLLYLVGASMYRCRKCEARFARVRDRMLPLDGLRRDKTHYWAIAAIAGGFITVFAIALYVLRVTHRWPF
jgi:DNA-directed RNA polymerase subunit RPC12/RpoP